MKTIYRLLILTVIAGIACTNLDEHIYDSIPGDKYPENADQVAAASVPAYAKMQHLVDDGNGDDGGWWFWAQEVSSDELVFPTRDGDWEDGGKWRVMHQHDWTNDVEGINRMWQIFWNGITRTNQILDFYRGLEITDDVVNKIKELEVLRSYYYYLLIDNYGDAPYLTTTIDVPDLPYKISRAAIFDSLVTTVENNLPYLKAINNKLLATRYMGFALLAKLYINAEVYTGTENLAKAEQYIDSVLAGPFSLENSLNAAFATNNEGSSENIFTIPYDEDNFQGLRIHMRTLHYQSNETYDMTVGPWNGCAATFDHFNTYVGGDLRKDAFFIYGPQYQSNGNEIIESVLNEPLVLDPDIPALLMDATYTPKQIRTTGARIGKYEIAKGAKENLSNDFPIFRITDFYLMKAEVLIRQGENGDDWVNPIRQRAGVLDWAGTSLDSLLAERGRELFAEGHRRQDLIRFGKFTNAWWGKGDAQGGVSGDESVETFPIPKWATDSNPNLLMDPQ